MHLGCFFFCIRVSQLLTLGWRSSCLRRPVFSCRVSLCGLFVTLQTIFLISDCWLQYTTKKGSFMRAETFYNTFFSMAHLSSVALLRRLFFRSHNKLFWPRVISFALLTSGMTEDGARTLSFSFLGVCVFVTVCQKWSRSQSFSWFLVSFGITIELRPAAANYLSFFLGGPMGGIC